MRSRDRRADRLRPPTLLKKVGALVASGALLASGLVAAATVLTAAPAAAESANEGSAFIASDNTFYAYLAEGDVLDVSFLVGSKMADNTFPHSYVITDPQGNVAWECELPSDAVVGTGCESPELAGPAGIWTIEDTQNAGGDGIVRVNWSIDVSAADGTELPGRVWAYAPYFSQDTGEFRDMNFWMVNDTGYQYQVSLDEYNGFQSIIQANATGVSDTECVPTYQSAEAATSGGGGRPADPNLRNDCEPQFRVFFAPPATDLPATAESATGTMNVLPPVLTSADLTVDDLAFTPSNIGGAAGTFTYSITDRFSGSYQLQIDTDGNGSYDDAVDRTIVLGADGSGSYSYEFDGLDGEGNPVADCLQMNARIYYPTVGEVHILQYDVEGRVGGIEVTALNGDNAGSQTIYWNDTNLADDRGNTTPVIDGTAGVDSAGGVHGWEFGNNSWGNNRIIDDWTYSPIEYATGEISVGGRCLDIDKTSDADEDTRIGDTVTYTVTATNTGDTDYTVEEPATFTDDLSGVLDDATYNEDATSDLEGEIAYTEPKLSWTGALASGETVELTYTVDLVAGGDGVIRNVAYGDTPDVPTPVCDPPTEEGTDPDTGIPCAVTEQELPRLSIVKSSDTEDLPADGGVVTYEVTVTNEGPGVYTEDAPAIVTDDLSDVLDDAEFNEIVAPADAVFDDDAQEITWSGPLDLGESVTIEYTVTYDAFSGDNILLNTACIPTEDALPGAEACDSVRIPAAELEVTKSVDPADGTSVAAGQEVTYTLSFASIGETAATVNKVDDLSDVLDDATLVDGSIATSNDALTAALEGESLSVTGEVPAGETYTVTYTVLVNDYDEQANRVLANVVQNPDGTCDPDGCPETENPIRHFDVTKTATPTEGVLPGDAVEYTITVTNDGEGDYTAEIPAGVTDDMTDVLDDATYNGDAVAVASDGTEVPAPTFESPVLAWSGPLAAGESVEITFTVTVTNAGDNDLVNVATPVCVEGEICEPPTPEVEILLPHIVPSKSSDPTTGETVEPGQVITYTLSWTNDGKAAGPVDSTDDLSAVVDDAELSGEPVVDDAHADSISAVFDEEAQNIRVTGDLAEGETVTVTYQVTVLADDERGDNELRNVVSQDTPPETCDEGDCPPPPSTEHFVPEIVDSKSVDPEKGTEVEPGQELTYTLTFENIGEAAGAVEKVDDLTHVLDDADITSEPVASDDALTVSPLEDNRYSITGELAAGQTVTVTYTVTVKAADELGDMELANFLMNPGPPPETPGECAEGSEDCTYNPVPKIEDSKSVDPASNTSVKAGQELTYTLTFTNEGAAAGEVDRVDDLTHVLDDADVTVAPVASDDALSVSAIENNRFSVTGTLEPGQTVTVSYTVTVKAADQMGDAQLANFLLDPEEEPPAEPVCTEGEDCTFNPVSDVTVTKTADPESGTQVKAGQEITYTLTFQNEGEGAESIDYTDHMAGVLDDADLTQAPTASDAALTVSEVEDGMFSVSGELGAGQTVTVTYMVTVRDWAEQGDHALGNFVTVTGQEPPTACVDDSTLCTVHSVEEPASPAAPAQPGPEEPEVPGLNPTGGDITSIVVLSALGLLILGGGAIFFTRRRKTAGAGEDLL